MAYKISWTPRAWKTFEANIHYLETAWSDIEIKKFVTAVDKKLINLSNHPRIGTARNNKYPNIRFTLIHKRVALIYRVKPIKEEVQLLVFWNTYQNPLKLEYL
ncbi:MAG TPA: type II toxin-antitoxin system RelE/ParE family toxin [Parafilimonas sp.]|nr:type II toxin-antitoxin system RelE/ParE family toxin [Parafilimonas sp.]